MKPGWLGLIELGVVAVFVLGWGILEWVALRMDRRRSRSADASPEASRHPEGE